MALVEIHGRPVGYSTSQTAVEREEWLGHYIARTIGESRRKLIHGVDRTVWSVVTLCGNRIEVVLAADYGFADARSCKHCEKSRSKSSALMIEVTPPLKGTWIRPEVQRRLRRQRGVTASEAF